MNKFTAYAIIILICLITSGLWFLSKQDILLITAQPLRSVSQILALLGIVLMSLTLIFTTRFIFLEKLFGGLDEVYGTHRILGGIAFIFIINHPLLLAIQSLPQVKMSLIYLLPSIDLSYSLGVFALYTMILSLLFTVFIKLPYHLWKWTHKLLGVAFLLASIHSLLVISDISTYIILRFWIGGFIALGVSSVIYTFFLYRLFGPKYSYQVEGITRSLDAVNIYLSSISRKIFKFRPGQFVYLKFENKSVGGQLHPFSIISAPQEEILRFSAKIVGDYTLKLPNLAKGDRAQVYGPYGKFGIVRSHFKNRLWVAGGIGITPFLSMLSSQLYEPTQGLINFFYTYRQKEEGIFTNQIQNIVQRTPNVRFYDWCSQEKKRLTVEEIKNWVDINSLDAIFLCGPLPMMESLNKQFISFGVPKEIIFYESFSL